MLNPGVFWDTERSEVVKKSRGHEGRGDPDVGVYFLRLPKTFGPAGAKPCASAPKMRRQKILPPEGVSLEKKNSGFFLFSRKNPQNSNIFFCSIFTEMAVARRRRVIEKMTFECKIALWPWASFTKSQRRNPPTGKGKNLQLKIG